MKLKTPFTVITKPCRDLDCMHDFSYKLRNKKQVNFTHQECKINPIKFTYKTYKV